MGYAIASELLKQGAEVLLVSGPVDLELKHPKLKLIKVGSANEMYQACSQYFQTIDIAIFAAAVADYRPASIASQKIKKSDDSFAITMVKNVDIAAEFGKVKYQGQLSIGFALETNDEQAHAINKLRRKNMDMVILNSMNDAGATFGHDTNKVTMIHADMRLKDFPLKDKKMVARDIVQEIASHIMKKDFSPLLPVE